MRRAGWHRRSRRPRVEMVPLMDCMFLLLTFFIYIATTMALQRGIPVDLAEAASAEALSKERQPVHIFVRSSGELFLEESHVTEGELSSRLRALSLAPGARAGNEPVVVVNADRGVVHEKVVGVLDLARQSGVSQVILAVEPKGQGEVNR